MQEALEHLRYDWQERNWAMVLRAVSYTHLPCFSATVFKYLLKERIQFLEFEVQLLPYEVGVSFQFNG